MDYKKSKAPVNTETRELPELWKSTGNIYESVAIIGKRANQIGVEIKQDLNKKLQEFASYNDSLDEVFETVSRSRSAATTRSCRNPRCWLPRSLLRATSIGAIPHRTTKRKRHNDSAHSNPLPDVGCGCAHKLLGHAYW